MTEHEHLELEACSIWRAKTYHTGEIVDRADLAQIDGSLSLPEIVVPLEVQHELRRYADKSCEAQRFLGTDRSASRPDSVELAGGNADASADVLLCDLRLVASSVPATPECGRIVEVAEEFF